ncbi:hypothetical protein [Actinomadura terrae]|uniref:hypothetical protein n=1 Tax=Actinomadura terrae TaxID=604353 RepID=UPI001FA6FC9F|nr:hypothetical protein [Actinomadura terrae]
MTADEGPVAEDVLGYLLLGLGLADTVPAHGGAGSPPDPSSKPNSPAKPNPPNPPNSPAEPSTSGAPVPACPLPKSASGWHDRLTRERTPPMDGLEIDWP